MKRTVVLVCLLACTPSEPKGGPGSANSAATPGPSVVASAAEEPVTPIPIEVEWDGAAEVRVDAPREIGCTGRAVREHLRIMCRGTEGKLPTGVETEEQGGGVVVSHGVRDGAAQLTIPVRRGVRLVAVFAFGERSHRVVVEWPDAQPTRPEVWAKFSESFPTPPSPCKPLQGRGSFGDPCVLTEAPKVVVKKVGDRYEVENPTDGSLMFLHYVVHYRDASGKRLDDDDNPSSDQVNHSLSLGEDEVIAPKTQRQLNLEVRSPAPNGTRTIEVVVCQYGLRQEGKELYFKAPDGCKSNRSKGE